LLKYLRSKKEDIAPAAPSPRPQPASAPEEIQKQALDEVGTVVVETAAVAAAASAPAEPLIEEREPPRPPEVFQGYDKYRVAVARLCAALADATENHDGKVRILRVANDQIAGKFTDKWEALLARLGFHGRIVWQTMDQVAASSQREVPLIVPHTLNTHLSEGWKRRQPNVYVIPVASPKLLWSYLDTCHPELVEGRLMSWFDRLTMTSGSP
jgi:hypothetical protein